MFSSKKKRMTKPIKTEKKQKACTAHLYSRRHVVVIGIEFVLKTQEQVVVFYEKGKQMNCRFKNEIMPLFYFSK